MVQSNLKDKKFALFYSLQKKVIVLLFIFEPSQKEKNHPYLTLTNLSSVNTQKKIETILKKSRVKDPKRMEISVIVAREKCILMIEFLKQKIQKSINNHF